MARMTNSEVGHAWYYNSDRNTGERGAENLFYSGFTVYSYGDHYPIARKVEGVVLFTVDATSYEASYGTTTAIHCSIVLRAIPSTQTIIFVDNPAANTKAAHQDNYTRQMERLEAKQKEIVKGRDGTGAQDDRIAVVKSIAEQMNLYTKLFKLGKRQMDIDTLLNPDTLRKQKEAEKKKAKREKIKRERQEKQQEIADEGIINEWKEGRRHQLPFRIKKCYLRINSDNQTVETSQAASIDLQHARLLFTYIQLVLNGRRFTKKHFGSFMLNKIDKKGNITIGCHQISYAEMERINNLLPAA